MFISPSHLLLPPHSFQALVSKQFRHGIKNSFAVKPTCCKNLGASYLTQFPYMNSEDNMYLTRLFQGSNEIIAIKCHIVNA